jgi:hypothetical protein
MGQLPGACHAQHSKLDQDPPHDAGVGALGLIAELGFTFLFATSQSVSPGVCFHMGSSGCGGLEEKIA